MIIILGAGIIGLFLGHELLKKGKKVKIFDTSVIKGKSTDASVGMLAPLIEAKPQEKNIFFLMNESKILWEKLQKNKEFSNTVGLKSNSSLMVALNKDDEEKLKFKKKFFETIGFKTFLLNSKETLSREPNLNSNVTASLFCKKQDQVNPVTLKNFLHKEILKLGGEIIIEKKIKKIEVKKNKVFFNNKSFNFEKIVISCGIWSSEIIFNSFGLKMPLRPLKGVSLILKTSLQPFNHNLWFRNIYIAQREKGILAIGATEEDKGLESSIKMDELYFLINSLWESIPKIEELELEEIKVGLRPSVFDGNPIIGPLEKISEDIICNFGHYRNGILLAPISSKIVTDYILGKKIKKFHNFFSPKRFKL